MAKHLGLSGAHRVGKSTLAKLFAERSVSYATPVKYADANIRGIIFDLGLDMKSAYDIKTRLYLQEKILEGFVKVLDATPFSIFDRTPLDFIAYMQADIQRDFPSNLEAAYETFEANCLSVTKEYFKCCIIQAGIPLVNCETSAQASPAYVEHLTNILIGLAEQDKDAINVMPRRITNLEQRVAYLDQYFNLKI